MSIEWTWMPVTHETRDGGPLKCVWAPIFKDVALSVPLSLRQLSQVMLNITSRKDGYGQRCTASYILDQNVKKLNWGVNM